jgi:hypothetical protein
MRYVLLVLAIVVSLQLDSASRHPANLHLQISLHYILSFSNELYGQATSLDNIKKYVGGGNEPPYKTAIPEDYYIKPNITMAEGRRANAAIVILGQFPCQYYPETCL